MKKILKNSWNVLTNLFYSVFNVGSTNYWEKNYADGLTSGGGSYGKYAEFKAKIINDFVKEKKIESIIDFGCGDGNQAALLKVNDYIGLDISQSVINQDTEKFRGNKRMRFFKYNRFDGDELLFKADLGLSLDVLYHLVEQDVFEGYISDLFSASEKYVMIYSTNRKNKLNETIHAYSKNRVFMDYIPDNWNLIKVVRNIYPKNPADFYIFKKMEEAE
jgi:SAM-dependent methyltransferase